MQTDPRPESQPPETLPPASPVSGRPRPAATTESTAWSFPRPRLVVSRCLNFHHCRYDGSLIPNSIIASLQDYVEFVPICPEVEIGLGVPRPPVRLVQGEGEIRLVQPDTGRDLTQAMAEFSATFLGSLPPVDGFILKNRSPSCAIQDARVHVEAGARGGAPGRRPGLFGAAVLARFPLLPVEDEGRLTNRAIREHFFTVIFALARLRQVEASGKMAALVEFHSRYKLLLMGLDQLRTRELGRIVANHARLSFPVVVARYRTALQWAFQQPPARPAMVNVLMHALGYFSRQLHPREKGYFLEMLNEYREGRLPLSTPVGVLRAWVVRFQDPYLAGQALFHPFPTPLVDLNDSGKGRSA
ncbi:MAG: hypothetical protein KatS3mg050_0213 [Litorilinea sp.]|nr:MAG: hypothetical protein KatS3mg050_0213 [Litorilinea sp.]